MNSVHLLSRTLHQHVATFAATVALMTGATLGQDKELIAAGEVKIDVDEISMMTTPDFEFSGAKKKKTPNRREWLELDFKFVVGGKSTTGYIGQLLFKYYVVLDDDKKTLLTSEVTHTNIPLDEEMYSSVYLSPGALAKYFGAGKASDRSAKGWAVEVFHNGVKVGQAGEPKVNTAAPWWLQMNPVGEVLQPKFKTPFSILWLDRYADSLDKK